jgi:hypothetical protein
MHAVTLHPVKLFLPLSLLDVPYIYGKSSRRLFAWSAIDTNPQSEPPSVVDGRTNGLDTKVRTPLHAAQGSKCALARWRTLVEIQRAGMRDALLDMLA